MWAKLTEKFEKYPARLIVAKKIMSLGFRIDENEKIYCMDVQISDTALAKSINVDRRAIKATVKTILQDKELSDIFLNISPLGPTLQNIASNLNLGIVELEASNETKGVLTKATSLISQENISIRQAYANDPELEDTPKLTIITECKLPSDLLPKFLEIEGITKVSIR